MAASGTGGVDQAQWLARRLGFDAVYGPTRRFRPGSTGNAVLSRWPVADVALAELPTMRGAYRRGLVRATVDVHGQEVHMFATHLDHVSPGLRRAQAQAVAAAWPPVTAAGAARRRPQRRARDAPDQDHRAIRPGRRLAGGRPGRRPDQCPRPGPDAGSTTSSRTTRSCRCGRRS